MFPPDPRGTLSRNHTAGWRKTFLIRTYTTPRARGDISARVLLRNSALLPESHVTHPIPPRTPTKPRRPSLTARPRSAEARAPAPPSPQVFTSGPPDPAARIPLRPDSAPAKPRGSRQRVTWRLPSRESHATLRGPLGNVVKDRALGCLPPDLDDGARRGSAPPARDPPRKSPQRG